MKVIIITLCFFIAFINVANAGEMYKCVDPDGNTIITDIPQDGMKCDLKSDDVRSTIDSNGSPDYNNANRNKSFSDDVGGDCREKFKALQEPMGKIIRYVNLSREECKKGNTKEAIEYLEQIFSISRNLTVDSRQAISSCTSTSQKKIVQETVMNLAKIQMHARKAITIIREKGCPYGGSE